MTSKRSTSTDQAQVTEPSAVPAMTVETVLGPVPAGDLGFVLPHEHLAARLWDIKEAPGVAFGSTLGAVYVDDDLLSSELAAFKQLGGGAVVELTLPAIGRDPVRYRRLSERTGVHVVMGCGWYREPFYPAEDLIERRSVDDLAQQLIKEIRTGVPGSGIRPGVIGEIGANNAWVSALEERVHRAAARAQLDTGLSITTHAVFSDVGLAQLKIFREEGVDPSRVAVGHCDTWPLLDYYLALLDQGAFVQLDNFGQWALGTVGSETYEQRLIQLIVELCGRGYSRQLLMSHDAFKAPQYQAYGGSGFCYIVEHVLPRLRMLGLDAATIEQLTVANPVRFLTGTDA
jgi:predicted metal-dependent phosphotriesterase family hydrolase